jgi:hypothetical protein
MLLDVNTGVTTLTTQLVPPDLLKELEGLHGDGIDDRGDLLVDGLRTNSASWEYESFILTPPGLAAPVPAPEPSTVVVFGFLATALGLRTCRRSRDCGRQRCQ